MKDWTKTVTLAGLVLFSSMLMADAKHDKAPSPMQQELNAIANLSLDKCPKCQGSMERGFILDDRGSLPNTDLLWVQGPVVHHKFGVDSKITRHIETNRCTTCGYLELYAKQP